MVTEIQRRELSKYGNEISEIKNVLTVVKNSGKMPKGKAHLYSRYHNLKLIKMKYRTTKTGHRVMDKVILTPKGKRIQNSFN